MKKKNKKNNLPITFIALLITTSLVIFVIWFIHNRNLNSPETPEAADYLFQSTSTMNFSVILPGNFIAEDRLDLIYFRTADAEITVDIHFTNYPDLASHLSDPRNDLLARVSEIEKLTINGYEAMSGILDNKKYFFIYVDHAVYFLSTTSPDLYDELDAIAQSFHYLGN